MTLSGNQRHTHLGREAFHQRRPCLPLGDVVSGAVRGAGVMALECNLRNLLLLLAGREIREIGEETISERELLRQPRLATTARALLPLERGAPLGEHLPSSAIKR